jgi:hypothetical protein
LISVVNPQLRWLGFVASELRRAAVATRCGQRHRALFGDGASYCLVLF